MRQAFWFAVPWKACCALWGIFWFLPGGQVGLAQNRVWDPIPVDSNWLNEENWVPEGVPTGSDHVKITNNGTYYVELSEDQTVRSLTLGAPAGMQSLLIENATLTVVEKSTVVGVGALTLENARVVGPLEVRQSTSTIRLRGGTLTSLTANEGLLEAVGSDNVVQTGPSNLNRESGTVRVLSESEPTSLTMSGPLFITAGRVELTSVAGEQASLQIPGGLVQNMASGAIQLSGEPGAAVLDLARLENHGSLGGQGRVTGNLVNHARMQVGAAPGTLEVGGSFSQSSGAGIEFEIAGTTAGTQHDVLEVATSANLDGRLTVDFLNGFQPADSDEFRIIRRDGGMGEFDTVQVSGIPGYAYSVDYEPDAVTLSFRQDGVLRGDYNDSGVVEQGDLDLVLLHWGSRGRTPLGWNNDLPDEVIDQDELDRVLLSWGNRAARSSVVVGIPEPSTWALLLLGAGAVLVSRGLRTGRSV